MDAVLFVVSSSAATALLLSLHHQWQNGRSTTSATEQCGIHVNEDNEPLRLVTAPKFASTSTSTASTMRPPTPPPPPKLPWYRATYLLIVQEPPHVLYEPNEWHLTTHVLLERRIVKLDKDNNTNDDDNNNDDDNDEEEEVTTKYSLPGGPVLEQDQGGGDENDDDDDDDGGDYLRAALRQLHQQYNIDVHQPHNCLHHLFTFPFEHTHQMQLTKNRDASQQQVVAGVWGGFYECIFRGTTTTTTAAAAAAARTSGEAPPHTNRRLEMFSLSEIKELLDSDCEADADADANVAGSTATTATVSSPEKGRPSTPFFTNDTRHALRLYFQRRGDLQARRRLLKGYSSADLQRYGLHHGNNPQGSGSRNDRVVLTRKESTPNVIDRRQEAVEYTMKTDDGMSPHLLFKADAILLGVSRTGKTPLSIFMAQLFGLKVANIPLVLELPPPSQLTEKRGGRVDPRRVFCLTLQPEFLERFRKSRFSATGGRPSIRHGGGADNVKRNDSGRNRDLRDSFTSTSSNVPTMSSSIGSSSSLGGLGSFRGLYGKDKKVVYSESDYVERDLEHARSLAREYGYTELDVTGRAMEETASLIVSKLKERFPESYVTL